MSERPRRQRIGVLGGTFDPIHIGHLLIAEHAREELKLDEVRFIPAAVSPLKLDRVALDAKHRLEMVQLAIGGNEHFHVDDRELQRGGTSFTVDTLAELSDEMPDSELVFLMGGDSLMEFHRWQTPERICKLAFVAIIARGGLPKPDMNLLAKHLPRDHQEGLDAHLVPMPQVEISSTDIRSRIGAGRSIRYQVHPGVESYIQANRLYGGSE